MVVVVVVVVWGLGVGWGGVGWWRCGGRVGQRGQDPYAVCRSDGGESRDGWWWWSHKPTGNPRVMGGRRRSR